MGSYPQLPAIAHPSLSGAYFMLCPAASYSGAENRVRMTVKGCGLLMIKDIRAPVKGDGRIYIRAEPDN